MVKFKFDSTVDVNASSIDKDKYVLPEGTYSATLSKAEAGVSREAKNPQVILTLVIRGDASGVENEYKSKVKSAFCSFPSEGEYAEWVCQKSATTLLKLLGAEAFASVAPEDENGNVEVNTELAASLLNDKIGTKVLFDVKYKKNGEKSDFPSNIRLDSAAPLAFNS